MYDGNVIIQNYICISAFRSAFYIQLACYAPRFKVFRRAIAI